MPKAHYSVQRDGSRRDTHGNGRPHRRHPAGDPHRQVLRPGAGNPFTFLPGQYVDVVVEGYQTIVGGYSLTSSPLHPERLHIAAKRLLDKPTSIHLNDRAQVGDRLFIVGPSGEFTWTPDMGTNLVLIAGGIGVTPFMSMIHYMDEAVPKGRATLIHSARSPSELLFRDELTALTDRNPNIRVAFTVTRPGAEPWTGHTGRINEDLLRSVGVDSSALYYVCGPAGFPESIGDLLQRLGVYTAARMRAESWT